MQASMGTLGYGRSLVLSAALLASVGAAGAQPQKTDRTIPPNSTVVFGGTASDFGTLTMNDGSVIAFDSSIISVTITADHLVVNGKAEIDLTSRKSIPDTPAKPGTPAQAGNNNAPENGQSGATGQSGAKGMNGVNLVFRVGTADVSNGSLWINTDGGRGGTGG